MEIYKPYKLPDPFCVSIVRGNILFTFMIHNTNLASMSHYRPTMIHKTCNKFTQLVTKSQHYIDFIEDAAINGHAISVAGAHDFTPQITYHNFYDSDGYTLKPHANKPIKIRINITNFTLFQYEIDLANIPGDTKPQRSIMPTQEELLEFLNKGECIY